MDRESLPTPPERSQRMREAAVLLPLVGLFLLLPPLIGLFAAPLDIGGVPLVVLYLFAVWLGLVIAAMRLGRGLELPAPPDEPADPSP